jgi:hypothetical protein
MDRCMQAMARGRGAGSGTHGARPRFILGNWVVHLLFCFAICHCTRDKDMVNHSIDTARTGWRACCIWPRPARLGLR